MPEELEYDASHILIPTEEQAKAIVKELRGGADFAKRQTLIYRAVWPARRGIGLVRYRSHGARV